MTTEELQKYLDGILAIELNIYVQSKTVAALTRHHNSLAKREKLCVPQRGTPQISFIECAGPAGIISGIVVGIIALVIEWNRAQGFFYYIAAVIAALIYAVGGLIAGGILFGAAAWLILRSREQKRLEEDFQQRVAKYDANVKRQNERIAREKAQQAALVQEITTLKNGLSQSRSALARAYAFNILAPEYRNIYAVSSILGYLTKGRTHSLQFNQQTGDQGAYNIYETERRLDRIITNTDEILDRFDQVILYQQDLAVGLQDASRRIESLCGNVTTQLRKISGSVRSIERSQDVIAYNTECAARELEFMNWMEIWR